MNTAFILNNESSAFRPALTLGQGLPTEKEGKAIKYYWKEMLPLGRYLDKDNKPFEVDEKRIGGLIESFHRAKAKGFLPKALKEHNSTSGDGTYGNIIDLRRNANGSLEGLHQLIGEDAHLAAARNGSSVCVLKNVTDEHGETYPELLDHNAIIPNPRLTGLKDFEPAIAASRGHATSAVVFELSTTTQESIMDLTKLREAIGAPKEITDTDLIVLSVAKLAESKTALELSKTQLATAETSLATEKTRADTNGQKVLELSRAPDPAFLNGMLELSCARVDLYLEKGKATKAQADLLKASLKDGDKPNALMLSKSGVNGSPLDLALKVLELNAPFTGNATLGQPVPDPNAAADAPMTAERRDQLLEMTGAGRAILAGKAA